MLIKFSSQMVLLAEYKLPWSKLDRFISVGVPAVIGQSNGVAANEKRK
jgi:hypothetical protein